MQGLEKSTRYMSSDNRRLELSCTDQVSRKRSKTTKRCSDFIELLNYSRWFSLPGWVFILCYLFWFGKLSVCPVLFQKQTKSCLRELVLELKKFIPFLPSEQTALSEDFEFFLQNRSAEFQPGNFFGVSKTLTRSFFLLQPSLQFPSSLLAFCEKKGSSKNLPTLQKSAWRSYCRWYPNSKTLILGLLSFIWQQWKN